MPKSKSRSKTKSKSRSRSPSHSKSSKSRKTQESSELETVMPYDSRRSKYTSTYEDFKDEEIDDFRCTYCKLVYPSLISFTEHNCWRDVYEGKVSLINDRILVCRRCHTVIYKSDYKIHKCVSLNLCDTENEYGTPEDLVALDSNFHLDFYINWAKRKELEELRKDYNANWSYEQRCNNCGNEFKTKFKYIMHSCFLSAKLTAEETRRLKTCLACKMVFKNAEVYKDHRKNCTEKAFMTNFVLEPGELILLQLIQTRQAFDMKQHKTVNQACFESIEDSDPFCMHPRNKPPIDDSLSTAPMKSTCKGCRTKYENLEDFLLHPCVAGTLITPLHLESIMYCDGCYSLFLTNEALIEHFGTCQPHTMTFVRLNTPRLLKYALKRWTVDLFENPYLPARPIRFECCQCSEVFRQFGALLGHPCPLNRESYVHGFNHPYNIMETFSCQACHRVFFTTHESIQHAQCCPLLKNPYMIQIHYDLDEICIVLDCWMRCTQLLSLELTLEDSSLLEGRGEEIKKNLNCYKVTRIKPKVGSTLSLKSQRQKPCLDEEDYTLLDCSECFSILKSKLEN